MKRIPGIFTKPKFRHDCNKCIYLGQSEDHDLYFCGSQMIDGPTVICRYGNEPEKNSSGWCFGEIAFDVENGNVDIPMADAFIRAIKAGLAKRGKNVHSPMVLPLPDNLIEMEV